MHLFELARFSANVAPKHSGENCHTETFWFTSVACLPLPDRKDVFDTHPALPRVLFNGRAVRKI